MEVLALRTARLATDRMPTHGMPHVPDRTDPLILVDVKILPQPPAQGINSVQLKLHSLQQTVLLQVSLSDPSEAVSGRVGVYRSLRILKNEKTSIDVKAAGVTFSYTAHVSPVPKRFPEVIEDRPVEHCSPSMPAACPNER